MGTHSGVRVLRRAGLGVAIGREFLEGQAQADRILADHGTAAIAELLLGVEGRRAAFGTVAASVRASATRAAQTMVDFLTPRTRSAYLPGTTWHFQFIDRDRGGLMGFNGTGGASISFRP